MEKFEVNLIRNRVLPPARRQQLYWLLMAYIGVAGVLLVVASRFSAFRLMGAEDDRRALRLTEEAFRTETGADTDVLSYAGDLRDQLSNAEKSIHSIDVLLRQRANMPRILLGLMTPLPAGFTIDNLSVRYGDRSLSFELRLPAYVPDTNEQISQLVHAWNTSTSLTPEAEDIQVMSRRREGDGEDPELHLRVVGRLKRGGA